MTLRKRWAFLGMAMALIPAAAPAPADWDARWYNPKPADDDLVLPIPCGGSMVFRPVDVPEANSPLADDSITLGAAEGDIGFIEYQRAAYLAAPFAAGDSARRYYIGKYDVTRDQYAAIHGPDCPTPSPAGRLPQAGVSWFDAVQAAATMSSFLLAHAREKLPKRGDALAYVRLPTEDEWEYAARGGTRVTESEFLAPTWPMPDGIERYAQAGSRVTGGRAQQVGQLKPNPLGLYDMLGNVQQMMLESFRLNRVGRLHGQAGGVVIRGGDYTSPPFSLHTAMRAELPPYDATSNAPTKLATVGFRLVLSAPTVGSLRDTEEAKQTFDQEVGRRQTAADDPTLSIKLLREALPDENLRRSLDQIAAKLASQGRDRADQDRVVVVAQLEAAAVMANFVWSLERNAKQLESMIDVVFAGQPAEQDKVRATVARRREQQKASASGYLRLVRRIALGPVGSEVEAQAAVLRKELTDRGQQQLFDMLTVATKHALFERTGQALSQEKAIADINAVPASEATR